MKSTSFAKSLLPGALLLISTAMPLGAATISFENPSSTIVEAGQTFTIQVYGETNSIDIGDGGGYDLYLGSNAPSNDLTLTSQSLNTTDFTYLFGAPTTPETISGGQTSSDLGFATSNSEDLPAGTPYLLSTETFEVSSSTPTGNYEINDLASPGSDFFESDGVTYETAGVSDFDFQVVAVPEPSSLELFLCGSGFFGLLWAFRSMMKRLA